MSGPCRIHYKVPYWWGGDCNAPRTMKCWSIEQGNIALRRKQVRKGENYNVTGFDPAPKQDFVVRAVRRDGDGTPTERHQRFTSRRAAKRWAKWATKRNADHIYRVVDTRPKRTYVDKIVEVSQLSEPAGLQALAPPRYPWMKPAADAMPEAFKEAPASGTYIHPPIAVGDSIVVRLPVAGVTVETVIARVADSYLSFDRGEILHVIKTPLKTGERVRDVGNVDNDGMVIMLFAGNDKWAVCQPEGADQPPVVVETQYLERISARA